VIAHFCFFSKMNSVIGTLTATSYNVRFAKSILSQKKKGYIREIFIKN